MHFLYESAVWGTSIPSDCRSYAFSGFHEGFRTINSGFGGNLYTARRYIADFRLSFRLLLFQANTDR